MLFNQQFRHDFIKIKFYDRAMCLLQKFDFILCPLPDTHLILWVIAEHIVPRFTAKSCVWLSGNVMQKFIEFAQFLICVHSSAPAIAIR